MGGAEEASGAVGAGWPSSPTSMASSLWEEVSDSSPSEGGRASCRGGGTGLALHSLKNESSSSAQFEQWGGELGQQLETALVSPPWGHVGF